MANKVTVGPDDSTVTNPVEVLTVPGFVDIKASCDSAYQYQMYVTNISGHTLDINGGLVAGESIQYGTDYRNPIDTLNSGASDSTGSNSPLAGLLTYNDGAKIHSAQITQANRVVGGTGCIFTLSVLY